MRNAAVGPPLLTRSPFSWRKDVNLQRRLPTALWTDTGNVSLAALRNNRPIKPASERRRRRGQSPSSLSPLSWTVLFHAVFRSFNLLKLRSEKAMSTFKCLPRLTKRRSQPRFKTSKEPQGADCG